MSNITKRTYEVEKLLEIIRAFFSGKEDCKECNKKLVKKTAMDGIVYSVTGEFAEGFEAVRNVDKHNENIINILGGSPCRVYLIKDSVFKIKDSYKRGTRYSCDVDVYVKNIRGFDSFLRGKGFLLDGVDISEDKRKTEIAYKANTDVSMAYVTIEKDIERIEKCRYRGNRKMHFSNYDKFNYYHKKGGTLDVHLTLSETNKYVIPAMKGERLKGNLFSAKGEETLLLNAIHFIENFRKYDTRGYQGFLKYITDTEFLIKSTYIDWKRLVNLAEESGASAETWFYLRLARKHLNADVPEKVIRILYRKSSMIKRLILGLADPYNIFTNRKDYFIVLFSRLYLDGGFINRNFRRILF